MGKAPRSGTGANLRDVARPPDHRARSVTASFPVVGVGASAAGLDAFRQLLVHVPASAGLALVLVQHLEPKRPSLLSDALGRATSSWTTTTSARPSQSCSRGRARRSTPAHRPKLAWRRWRPYHPDVILCDIAMHREDG